MSIYDLKIKSKTLTGAMLLVAITIDFGLLVKVYIGYVFQILLDKLGQPARECNHTELPSQSKAAREGASKYAEQYRAGVAALETNQQAILSVFNSSRLVYE